MPGSRNVTGGNGGKGFSGARNVAGVRIFRGLPGCESSPGSAASARHQLDRTGRGASRTTRMPVVGRRSATSAPRRRRTDFCMDGGRLFGWLPPFSRLNRLKLPCLTKFPPRFDLGQNGCRAATRRRRRSWVAPQPPDATRHCGYLGAASAGSAPPVMPSSPDLPSWKCSPAVGVGASGRPCMTLKVVPAPPSGGSRCLKASSRRRRSRRRGSSKGRRRRRSPSSAPSTSSCRNNTARPALPPPRGHANMHDLLLLLAFRAQSTARSPFSAPSSSRRRASPPSRRSRAAHRGASTTVKHVPPSEWIGGASHVLQRPNVAWPTIALCVVADAAWLGAACSATSDGCTGPSRCPSAGTRSTRCSRDARRGARLRRA